MNGATFFAFARKFVTPHANYKATAVSVCFRASRRDRNELIEGTMSINGSKCNITAILPDPRAAKRVVLAGRFKLAAKVTEQFRKLGWEVHTVPGEVDVHAAVVETDPHAILLLEDTGTESGYLACAKLLQTQPDLKVVVVGEEWTPQRERFAEFVGATFATDGNADELVAAVV